MLRLVASPNLASKTWVTQQYDRYVLGNTVLAQPEDAGVIRVDEVSGLGVALSTDCNGRFAKLDPYDGAQLALAEAYRNVAATGAAPLAVTNCLNFGSPEDPDVMWQFAQAVTGLADGCLELGIPVTGGNVSFYNQTGEAAIHPTPVVGVLGVIDDVERRTPMAFTTTGDLVLLLGETRDEVAGSEWAHVVHGHLGGLPPMVDLELERSLGALLVEASSDSLVTAAHDVSDGGSGAGARRDGAARRRRRHGHRARGRRPVRAAALGVDRPRGRHRRSVGVRGVPRRRGDARRARHPARRGDRSTTSSWCSRRTTTRSSGPRGAARRLRGDPARPVRLSAPVTPAAPVGRRATG